MILALVTATTAISIRRRNAELADAGRELRTLDLLLSEETGRSLQSVELVLQSVADQIKSDGVKTAADLAGQESTLAMHQFLRARVAGIPQLDAITLISAQGRLINFSRGWPIPDVTLVDRDYFIYLRTHDTDQPFLSEPVVNRGSGTWTIYLAKRITGPDGSFLGLLLGATELNYFERFYASLHLGPGDSVSLWRQDGVLLARYPSAAIGQHRAILSPPSASWHGAQGVFETSVGLGGVLAKPRIIASQPVPGFPALVNLARSKALILADWRREVITISAAVGLAIACVFLLMRAVMRRFRAYEAVETALREREKAILARQEIEDAFRQSQKMEAVGQLTGGVAHDFNNLLTVIRSSVDLLRRPDLPEERRQRYVGAIADATARAAKLTSQLLAFARRQALKPEVFNVTDNIAATGEMVSRLVGSRIVVDLDLPETACFIHADPSQFDTALVNMAVNARDAMDGEGRLKVSVRVADQIPAIRAHPPSAGDFVAVAVSDTGSGIAPDALERIFEPFFTTKKVGEGTGLGLSQVFGFAKQSGGEITVESAPGQGATFTLYLPRATAVAARREASQAPAPLADAGGTRVLVVEDNKDVGSLTTQTLAELGYSTVWATNADEALAELGKTPDRFDIVFSDVIMPGMDGVALGQEIRRRYATLPVVLTSGYSHVLAQNGGHGFELLHKPYSVEQLAHVLRKAADRRRTGPSGHGG